MSSLRRPIGVMIPVTALVYAGLVAIPVAATAAATPSLSRASSPAISAPAQVSSGQAKSLGPAVSTQRLRLAIALKHPHAAEEDAYVASLKDKKSPNYRHFLTAAQWAARFAPSAADEAKVVSWAKSQGLTVSHRYPNRLLVDIDSTVGTIQKAFHLTINNYRLGNKTFYSNDRGVALPSAVSGVVLNVSGLNSLQALKALGTGAEPSGPAYSPGAVHTSGVSAAANGSRAALAQAMAAAKARKGLHPAVTGGFYDPTDIYSDQAYGVDALNAQGHCCNPTHAANVTPPATSIAIANASSEAVGDVQQFKARYNYLAYHFQEFNIDGTPPCCNDAGSNEGTMDLEWATTMANSFGSFVDTAMVYMYNGVNSQFVTFDDIWNHMLSDNLARTMSTSYGCAESFCYTPSQMNTDHGIFNSMLIQGWTLIGISHDKGAFADCVHRSASYPGSDPDLLSSGGTTLQAAGGFQSEVAWTGGSTAGSCSVNNGGGGGGCSVQWGLPSYQSGRINGVCSTRAEPDISLNASIGQNVYWNGGWRGGGGTSIVAPELAGIWAQINAYLGSFPSNACSGGCTTVGQANFDVYNAVAGTPHDPYYDITSGCTNNDIGSGYCGIVGYDRATGLGSANMEMLAWSVIWGNVSEASAPTVTISGPGSGWVNSGTLSWSVVDNGSPAPVGVAGYSYRWDSDPGNPTTEPHGGSGNVFWDGPQFKNATSGSIAVSSGGQGCHTLFVRAWDNQGLSSLSTYGTCFDSGAPTFTAKPNQRFAAGQTLIPNGLPVQAYWTGADSLSGVKGFYVYRRDDSGSYNFLGFQTSPSIIEKLTPAHQHQYLVYVLDNAGNLSAASTTANFTPNTKQETSSQITYSSGWTAASVTGASAGKVKFATTAGKTATFTFTGNRWAFVSTLGSTRGVCTVSADGGTPTTVNTNASTTTPAYLARANGFSTNASHTVKVTVSGTSGHPRIDVDAFLYMTV